MRPKPTIAILGLWHQGLVAAACLAGSGHRVLCVSTSKKETAALGKLRLPVEEPGLKAALAAQMKNGNLTFSADIQQAIGASDFIFLMHDLPVNQKDESNDAIVFADVKAILPHVNDRAIITVTAQCVVGTCKKIQAALEARKKKNPVCYIPENLRLGLALERFKNPALPVIGAESEAVFRKLAALLAPFSGHWQRTDVATAEMLKHALNTYLALTIAFANEIGTICELVGADGHAIGDFLKLEPRIGKKAMLRPGLGYGGGTLGRDIRALGKIAQERKIKTPLIDGVAESNRLQHRRIFDKIKKLCAAYPRPAVCILGLTYKPDTSATRRSAAIEVIRMLQREGYSVKAYDPGILPDDPNLRGIAVSDTMEAALKNAHVAVLMTPWSQFARVRPAELKKWMRGNIVFDPNNFWNKQEFARHNMDYVNFGIFKQASGQ